MTILIPFATTNYCSYFTVSIKNKSKQQNSHRRTMIRMPMFSTFRDIAEPANVSQSNYNSFVSREQYLALLS